VCRSFSGKNYSTKKVLNCQQLFTQFFKYFFQIRKTQIPWAFEPCE